MGEQLTEVWRFLTLLKDFLVMTRKLMNSTPLFIVRTFSVSMLLITWIISWKRMKKRIKGNLLFISKMVSHLTWSKVCIVKLMRLFVKILIEPKSLIRILQRKDGQLREYLTTRRKLRWQKARKNSYLKLKT